DKEEIQESEHTVIVPAGTSIPLPNIEAQKFEIQKPMTIPPEVPNRDVSIPLPPPASSGPTGDFSLSVLDEEDSGKKTVASSTPPVAADTPSLEESNRPNSTLTNDGERPEIKIERQVISINESEEA